MSRPVLRLRFCTRLSRARPLSAAAVSVLVALIGAACGSTPGPSSSAGAPARSASSETSTASAAPGATTATDGAPPAGTGTANPATLPGSGRPPITIGDKNYTEQMVLGELYRVALQAQGFTVDLNQNIGPTDVTLQALKGGMLAMYPEYLNVFNAAVAGNSRSFPSASAAYGAAQRYARAHGLQLLAPTPFSSTDAIGVTVGYAQAHHLASMGDLVGVSATLTIGGPLQFEQITPGLASLEAAYGFRPLAFKALAVGDQYTGLNNGTIQAANVRTTDGQLTSGDYQVLDDPLRVFGWGNVVPVVSAGVVAAEGPAFVSTIERVDALLTTQVIRQLNAAVDLAGQDPAAVATQFLETHNLIAPAPP